MTAKMLVDFSFLIIDDKKYLIEKETDKGKLLQLQISA